MTFNCHVIDTTCFITSCNKNALINNNNRDRIQHLQLKKRNAMMLFVTTKLNKIIGKCAVKPSSESSEFFNWLHAQPKIKYYVSVPITDTVKYELRCLNCWNLKHMAIEKVHYKINTMLCIVIGLIKAFPNLEVFIFFIHFLLYLKSVRLRSKGWKKYEIRVWNDVKFLQIFWHYDLIWWSFTKKC